MPGIFQRSPVIEQDEIEAIESVLKKGALSGFRGAPGNGFLGGEKVREFEEKFASYFGVKYAVTFNSCTSALHGACVACGIKAGDEVVVTPFSFTSSAKCALYVGAKPVFADIQNDIFCIDPKEIEKKITPKTRAIIPVHLCGHPADMDRIMAIASKYGIKVIEDSAQAIGATYKGRYTGTIGHCGVFSFDYAKTMTTGEGGMLITDNPEIAEIAQAVRNHGEMLGGDVLGFNYRMTEFQAAMGIVQFSKLGFLNDWRIKLCDHLTERLMKIGGIVPPKVYYDCKHVYFTYAIKVKENRDEIVKLLNDRGIYMGAGYNRPLHLLPIYKGKEGDCPVAEQMYNETLMVTDVCKYPQTIDDMDYIADTLEEICKNVPI